MNDNQQYQQYQQYQPAPAPQAPKKKKKWTPWIVGGIAVIFFFNVIGGGDEASTEASTAYKSTPTASAPVKMEKQEPVVEESQVPAEPATPVKASTMIDTLETNALKAKKDYEGKRVKVSGYVGNIDASGKYFTIDPEQDAIIFTGIQVYTQNEEQKSQLAELSKNDSVTVTGKVTAVGEIMGYAIDIEEIH